MELCNWCGRPYDDGWCTEICKLRDEKKELEFEVKHLKEQIKMWQDQYSNIVKIRDQLVERLDDK